MASLQLELDSALAELVKAKQGWVETKKSLAKAELEISLLRQELKEVDESYQKRMLSQAERLQKSQLDLDRALHENKALKEKLSAAIGQDLEEGNSRRGSGTGSMQNGVVVGENCEESDKKANSTLHSTPPAFHERDTPQKPLQETISEGQPVKAPNSFLRNDFSDDSTSATTFSGNSESVHSEAENGTTEFKTPEKLNSSGSADACESYAEPLSACGESGPNFDADKREVLEGEIARLKGEVVILNARLQEKDLELQRSRETIAQLNRDLGKTTQMVNDLSSAGSAKKVGDDGDLKKSLSTVQQELAAAQSRLNALEIKGKKKKLWQALFGKKLVC